MYETRRKILLILFKPVSIALYGIYMYKYVHNQDTIRFAQFCFSNNYDDTYIHYKNGFFLEFRISEIQRIVRFNYKKRQTKTYITQNMKILINLLLVLRQIFRLLSSPRSYRKISSKSVTFRVTRDYCVYQINYLM